MPERIKMKHAETGAVVLLLDTKHWRDAGWSPVDESTPTTEQQNRRALNDARRGELNERPAAEVVAAMATLPDDERERVVAAEKSGKARKTVLDAD
jgi:hypothetical protein